MKLLFIFIQLSSRALLSQSSLKKSIRAINVYICSPYCLLLFIIVFFFTSFHFFTFFNYLHGLLHGLLFSILLLFSITSFADMSAYTGFRDLIHYHTAGQSILSMRRWSILGLNPCSMSDDVNESFELTTVPRDRSDMIIWPIQLKNYPLLL